MNKNEKVIVIGGGPAGMMAAGTAGSRGLNVILIEKNNKLGKKLSITGKGRCNITNAGTIDNLIENIPVNRNFLYSAFYTFSNDQLIKFFNQLGLETKVERGDRVFPVSDKATDVVKTLEKYLKMNNVKVIQSEVNKIMTSENKITHVNLSDGQNISCQKVIIATGGLSYPVTGSTGDGYSWARELGHTVTKLRPSLVPLEVEEDWVKKADRLNLRNIEISIYDESGREVFREFGEMSFKSYGISGPVVLSASSHLKKIEGDEYKVCIDLKPALSSEKLDKRIQRDFKKYSRKQFSNSLQDLLPQKIIPVIIDLSNISPDKPVNQINKNERNRLVKLLKNLKLTIKNYRSIDEAIVTSGGVETDEIDPATMESKLLKGLFFAGEIINVDGYTGGYNLQIAFSTGYLAGMNC